MTYARVENGAVVEYPVHAGQIKERYPNISFSIPFSPPDGYEEVGQGVYPTYDINTHRVWESTPVRINGVLRQTWVVEPLSQQELNQRAASKADSVRQQRNQRLSATDWTQLLDSPVNARAAYTTYRQALRDLPTQTGFPWNVIWPQEPNAQG
jgi:hypothetical protein